MRKHIVSCLALTLLTGLAHAQVKTPDWPQWRGPQRNAVSTETGLLKAWPKGGPKLLWDSKKVNMEATVGAGYSSLAIVKGKIYTMGDTFAVAQVEFKNKEGKIAKKNVKKGTGGFVFCLDAETGKEIWRKQVAPGQSDGPRSTPTIDGAYLYALSPNGKLTCLKIADGAFVWQKDLVKEFGGRTPGFGGYAESPTIDGDKLIIAPGGKKNCMAALNKLTGDTYWTCEAPADDRTGFGSIVKAEVGGVKMYITLAHKQLGLIGVDADTGKFLWTYQRVGNGTANIPTALVQNEYVFTSTGYDDGGSALLKLVATGDGGVKAEEQYYRNKRQLQNHHGGMVMIGKYIFGGHGHNDGKPFCLEWKTGDFAWGPERGAGSGSAAVLYADGRLYFRYQSGEMALINATPKGYNLISSFTPPIAGNGWPHPVIYQGRLFLRGQGQILCYDIKQ